MNTAKRGKVRYIVFKESNTWFGVALEFNIVVESDSADVVSFNLQEAIRGYVESMRKIKGSRSAPLNQKPDAEYLNLWDKLAADKPVPSPIQVRNYGFARV